MSKPTYGIQAAPFSRAIHVGKLNKDGSRFLDTSSSPREDCTDMAIRAVGDFAREQFEGSMQVDFADCTITVTTEAKEIDDD